MSFRAITGDNDWTFGKGSNGYFIENAAIMADIKTALLFFLNDCFFATDVGIDWWGILGGKQAEAKAEILLQTRETIINRAGVTSINSVDTKFNPGTRRITVTYNINTIYGQNVTGSVSTP